MKSWTIGRRIVVGFSTLILLAASFGAFALYHLGTIRAAAERITRDCLPAIYLAGQLAEKMQSLGNDNSTLLLKEILSPNEETRAGFDGQIQTNLASMVALDADYQSHARDEREREMLRQLAVAREKYAQLVQQIVALSRDGKSQEAMELKQGQLEPQFVKVLAGVHAAVDFNRAAADTSGAEIQSSVQSSRRAMALGGTGVALAGIILSAVIALGVSRILRRLAATLADGSAHVAATAEQFAGSSQMLARGASEQAASLEETGASLEEMLSMAQRNTESAERAKIAAATANESATQGTKEMLAMKECMGAMDAASNELRRTMDLIDANTGEMRGAMDGIQSSSKDISRIIKTINEIAFQTNILALNAAVEAARAGQAGMGFAVVADEVRNLAQRSAFAANETAEKIETSILRSQEGARVNEKVASSLQEMMTKVQRVHEHIATITAQASHVDSRLQEIASRNTEVDQVVAGIACASREQTQGISQINSAVTRMDRVTQANAAGAEESASGSEELNSQAKALQVAVSQLRLLVGGAASGSARAESPAARPTVLFRAKAA